MGPSRARHTSVLPVGLALCWCLWASGARGKSLATARKRVLGSGATTSLPFLAGRATYINNNYAQDIRYSGIGSGAGRQQFIASATLYCSTDVPMSVAEENQMAGYVKFTMPMALQTITIFTSLPGAPQIRLTASVAAKIFSRKITKWNDAEVVALNLALTLPNKPIAVVVRQDSSGSTALFTGWLSKAASSAWKLGSGGQITWPQGVVAVQYTSGVVSKLKKTKYAISYASTPAGLSGGLGEALIRNKAGRFVQASTADVNGAIPIQLPPPTASWASVSLLLASGPKTWPITSFSYLLARKNQYQTGLPAGVLVAWLNYLFSDSVQPLMAKFEFYICPVSVLNRNKAAVKTMQLIAGTVVPTFK